MNRTLPISALAMGMALLLAACTSTDTGIGGSPSLSMSETVTEAEETWSEVSAAMLGAMGADSSVALRGVPSLPLVLPFDLPSLGTAAAPQAIFTPLHVEDAASDIEMPRGVYEYSEDGGWSYVGPLNTGSDKLEAYWTFRYDADGPEYQARLIVSWVETVSTVTPSGATVEMPTDMYVFLGVRDAGEQYREGGQYETVGDLRIIASYRTIAGCGTLSEPTYVSVDGHLGSESGVHGQTGRIDFEDLVLGVVGNPGNESINLSGAITASAGAQSLTLDLDLALRGELVRDQEGCFLQAFDLRNGQVRIGARTNRKNAQVRFEFDNHEATVGTGPKTEITEGSLIFGRRTAATFAGTFDDENGNGVPGDNVEMRYRGERSTLEEFLIGTSFASHVGTVAGWVAGLIGEAAE